MIENPSRPRTTYNINSFTSGMRQNLPKPNTQTEYVKELNVMVKKINKLQKARKVKKRELDADFEQFKQKKDWLTDENKIVKIPAESQPNKHKRSLTTQAT